MPLMNQETGALSFLDGLVLHADQPACELSQRLATIKNGLVCLPAHAVRGGSIAPVCMVEENGVKAISLHVNDVGGRECTNSGKQRAFLFSVLGFRDPCPDTRRGIRVRCPFGELLFVSDPHTGRACVRVSYEARR